MRLSVLLSTFVLSITSIFGCSAGRQATWERDAGEKLSGPTASTPSVVDNGGKMWADRANRKSLEGAIAAWTARVARDPSDTDALTKLARAYFFFADTHIRASGDKKLMLATFEKGVAAGERAMISAYRTLVPKYWGACSMAISKCFLDFSMSPPAKLGAFA